MLPAIAQAGRQFPLAAAPSPSSLPGCSGVDGLAHDPVANAWALTPAAYASAAAQAASWGAPLLLLGGGGYSSPAAACTWAGVLAALLGRQLPDDIPEHDHLQRYGPAFTLSSGAEGGSGPALHAVAQAGWWAARVRAGDEHPKRAMAGHA